MTVSAQGQWQGFEVADDATHRRQHDARPRASGEATDGIPAKGDDMSGITIEALALAFIDGNADLRWSDKRVCGSPLAQRTPAERLRDFLVQRMDDPELSAADRLMLISRDTHEAVLKYVGAVLCERHHLDQFERSLGASELQRALTTIRTLPADGRHSGLVRAVDRLARVVPEPGLWVWPIGPALVRMAVVAGIAEAEARDCVVLTLAWHSIEVVLSGGSTALLPDWCT